MAQTQGQVASAVPSARASGTPNLMQLQLGELGMSAVLPEYAALAWSGKVFGAYAAAQATSLVGTAMVGLQLWNGSPASGASAVNAILLYAGGAVIATAASQTGVVLAAGLGQVNPPTGQTAATFSGNNLIGGTAPACLALNAGTFTNAPVARMTLLHNTAAIAVTGEDQGYDVELKGMIVVPPQTYVAFAAIGAAGAASSNQHHLFWVELPV